MESQRSEEKNRIKITILALALDIHFPNFRLRFLLYSGGVEKSKSS